MSNCPRNARKCAEILEIESKSKIKIEEEKTMNVIIWTDMEGVAGIVAWDQVTGGKSLYEEGRRLLTEEVNAAVRGAKRAGAKKITVLDCHGAGGG